MAGKFMSPDGDLETIFVDDYAMIDQYAMTGSLWMSGLNGGGSLGDNTVVSKSSPVQTISGGTNWKQIVVSNNGGTLAIKTDGTLWTWGYNTLGQLGDGTTTNKSSPIQTISGGTNWKQLATTNTGYCPSAAIKTDGTLWMWGTNNYGQLGDNTTDNKSSPVQTVSGGTNWKQLSISAGHTAAIKTDGTLWLWGRADLGQLGNSSTVFRSSPVQTTSGGTDWKQVACGAYHTLGIKTNETLWSWGSGLSGGLGNGTTNRSSPVQADSFMSAKKIAGGLYCSFAISTNGTLYSTGNNFNGEQGNNTTTNRTGFSIISTGWKSVSCNGTSVSAIKTDGTLWCWGDGTSGELGIGALVKKSSPVQTVSGGTNWKQVSNGYHLGAIYFYDAGNLYPSA